MIRIAPTETFTLIDSITYVWHNEYVIDAEGPLTVAQVALTDKIVLEVDEHICAFDNEGDCLTETTSAIGFHLFGDRDEFQRFHAFYVSDERAICCECAHLQGVPLAQ
jgi:hypothetical protein